MAREIAFLANMNPRERRLLSILGLVLGALVLVALPIGLEVMLHAKRSDNEEVRAALEAVQAARPQVRERQAKKESITARYARRAPTLAGFLEERARAQKLEVSDSVDRSEVPHGKRYVERNTVIHLKKSGMAGIARFLESVEKAGFPIAVTRLNIRKRAAEADSYDVEVGVSAYDRSEEKASSKESGKDGKDGKEEKKP